MNAVSSAIAAGDTGEAFAEANCAEARTADKALVQRCLEGEVAAWEELYLKCHETLLGTIRVLLGRPAVDSHLVEEIAARVWFAVVNRDGAGLAKFDPQRGGIHTFLKYVAQDEIHAIFAPNAARLKHELKSMRRDRLTAGDRNESLGSTIAEFIATLTPHERQFCEEYLLLTAAEDGDFSPAAYSSTNVWQLTRRVYKKFMRYLGRDF